MPLTLQIFHNHQWHDAGQLDIPEPSKGRSGQALLSYHPQQYAVDHLGRDDEYAFSLNLPVDLMQTYRSQPWFAFLDDIMPAGASRRYWVNYLAIGHLPPAEQDYELLARGTIAPVGNLRIKQALPTLAEGSRLQQLRFQVEDVTERHSEFLEYAQAMGASSGGATGAGGEAPKFLLRRSPADDIWIDTWQDDIHNTDAHYLVKFPRGKRSADDCDILRAEFHYYQELTDLGQNTIATQGMQLLEGDRYPSLWLPRFDVDFTDGKVVRYGLESIYSLMNKPPGSSLNHFDCIRQVVEALQQQYRVQELGESTQTESTVTEWVKRDFLNVVFGNSDNHGRNTALIKRPNGIELAPIYDFAPMKADPEGVIRTTTWGSPFEEGGRYDWLKICQALDAYLDPEHLRSELRYLAQKLTGLQGRLADRGVNQRLLTMPALGFATLEQRLQTWQLLE